MKVNLHFKLRKIQVNRIDTFAGHKGPLYSMALNKSKNTLYTAGSDGFVVEWNLLKPDMGKVIAQTAYSIYSMYLDEEKNSLYLAQNLKGILKIDLNDFSSEFLVDFSKFWIYDFIKIGEDLWFVHQDGLVSVFSLSQNTILKKIKLDHHRIRKILQYQDKVFLGNSQGDLSILSKEGQLLKKQNLHNATLFDFTILDDAIYTVGKDAKIHKFQFNQALEFDLVKSVVGHIYPINTLSFNSSKTLFATGSMDKTIKIWDPELNLLKVIDAARHGGHRNSVNKLLWSDLNNQLFSISDDKMISIWNIE